MGPSSGDAGGRRRTPVLPGCGSRHSPVSRGAYQLPANWRIGGVENLRLRPTSRGKSAREGARSSSAAVWPYVQRSTADDQPVPITASATRRPALRPDGGCIGPRGPRLGDRAVPAARALGGPSARTRRRALRRHLPDRVLRADQGRRPLRRGPGDGVLELRRADDGGGDQALLPRSHVVGAPAAGAAGARPARGPRDRARPDQGRALALGRRPRRAARAHRRGDPRGARGPPGAPRDLARRAGGGGGRRGRDARGHDRQRRPGLRARGGPGRPRRGAALPDRA